MPADHFPLRAGGGDLVPRPLGDDLPLELGEREQDVEHQPAHRRRRVELLGHRDERHAVLVKRLHHPRKVEQAAAEPVHLVDHDAVDLAGLDVGHHALERRALHVAAGEAAVVVLDVGELPAQVRLALDVLLAGLPLGVEGVELLLEALLGALASVDRAQRTVGGMLVPCFRVASSLWFIARFPF